MLWYCSDNGALPKIGSSGGRRGNKGKIYEGGLLVPALLEWPAQFAEPQVVSIPCVTADILPTLLDIVDAKPEKSLPLDGNVNRYLLSDGTVNTYLPCAQPWLCWSETREAAEAIATNHGYSVANVQAVPAAAVRSESTQKPSPPLGTSA